MVPRSGMAFAGSSFLHLSFDAVQTLFTLSQLDDFILDARGDLTILALQLTEFQEFA